MCQSRTRACSHAWVATQLNLLKRLTRIHRLLKHPAASHTNTIARKVKSCERSVGDTNRLVSALLALLNM
eukprot:scaffold274397_cov35-Tisochrysis_lutea.AAC.2